jgi:hypothetical protein
MPGEEGKRPCHGDESRYATDPFWKDLILFYEHFHGDNGRGVGASHQTGWTSLVSLCIERIIERSDAGESLTTQEGQPSVMDTKTAS